MHNDKAILLILKYLKNSNEEIEGRTLIQKTIYFVNKILDLGIEFSPYYYGPYSSLVTETLEEMKQIGALQEEVERYPFDPWLQDYEPKLFRYKFTDFGNNLLDLIENKYPDNAKKIQEVVERIKKSSKNDYKILSIAGKMYSILTEENREMTEKEIIEEAKFLGWNISEEEAKKAIRFLEELDLIDVNNETPI